MHSGFYNISQKSIKKFKTILTKDKPIFITGHSLGGAISILMGATLYKEGYDVSVYTFGSPAVGNDIFIKYINGLKHYRYLHNIDVVAKLDETFVGGLKTTLLAIKDTIDTTTNQNNIFLDGIEELLHNVNYNYIHDDYKTIILTKKVNIKSDFQDIPFIFRFILEPIEYHNIAVYKEILLN